MMRSLACRRVLMLSLLLLVALMLSCRGKPMTATPTVTPMPTIGVKSYTSAEEGLSIQYPEGWIVERTIIEGFDAVIFRETVEEGAPELTVFSTTAEGRTVPQVLDETLSIVQMLRGEASKDWQVSEAEPATIGGRQGVRLLAEYTHAPSGARHRIYLIGVVTENMNYAFVADASLDELDRGWHSLEAMLDSVRFEAGEVR